MIENMISYDILRDFGVSEKIIQKLKDNGFSFKTIIDDEGDYMPYLQAMKNTKVLDYKISCETLESIKEMNVHDEWFNSLLTSY